MKPQKIDLFADTMVFAVWYERPVNDLLREAIIFLIVLLLFYRGMQLKCKITMVISMIIIIKHLTILLFASDILSDKMVMFGAILLSMTGYYRQCPFISLAGTYSVTSKFNSWCYWCHESEHTIIEVMKFMASIIIWIILFRLIVYYNANRYGKWKRYNLIKQTSRSCDV